MNPEDSRPARLRQILAGPRIGVLMEAHDSLSARIAAESGADGLWASSLTLSAVHGVRDHGELTMPEALSSLESMAERVDVPILFDADTGYGEFSHFQRLVRRLERRGVAGVCIEDKAFPKRNSFVKSEEQALAPVDEFTGKIRAGVDSRKSGLVLVARTEALVTGLGVRDALGRAEAYVDAGADAILVHSRSPSGDDVLEFGRNWSRRAPLVCVPTTYYSVPFDVLAAAGYSVAIAANQVLRASIRAMQSTTRRIVETRGVRAVEESIAPVSEVFRLQDLARAQEDETRYAGPGRRAVILAATRGEALGELTADRPKCLISVGGQTILDRMLGHLRSENVREIAVVRGYRPAAFRVTGVRFFDNDLHATTGEVASLATALDFLERDVVVAYGDLLVKRYVVHELVSSDAPVTIVADSALRPGAPAEDRVLVDRKPLGVADDDRSALVRLGADVAEASAHGEWIGLARIHGAAVAPFRAAVAEILARPDGERRSLDAVFQRLVDGGVPVRVLFIRSDWADVDSLADVLQDAVE
jgi:phosphoenolpyruvate phosphomutase